MDAATLAADGWEPALAAALIGADRAPPPAADGFFPAGADAAGALLARLAAHGIHRLAGASLAADALDPVPERAPEGPECPPAAALRLHALVTEGYSAQSTVAEWCDCAAAAGVRVPSWLLPLLLAYARQYPETRAGITAVAGPELAWLGRACGEAPDEPSGDPAEGSGEEADWQAGTWQERRAAFAGFRGRDPEAARAALEAGFKREKAVMREHFVAVMDVGLSAADEPFLEACLDDRAAGVRKAARNRLLRLRRSRLALRMAGRARAALALGQKRGPLGGLLGGTTTTLAVALPEESPELARDGIEPSAYDPKGGRRAGLLRDILACAPLHAFADHPPRLWVEGALRSEWPMEIVEGLYASVRDEGDVAWAQAMAATLGDAFAGRLAGIKRTDALLEMWARATALLPDAEWERTLTEMLRARQIEAVIVMMGKGPDALSEPFTAVFLDWLALVTRGSANIRNDLARAWILGGLHTRLHPGEAAAARAAAVLARLPEGTQAHLSQQLSGLAEALELRATIRREFA
ncbi:MAG: DUF5691 domain-containing protein [Methylobacterium frigidaeris]